MHTVLRRAPVAGGAAYLIRSKISFHGEHFVQTQYVTDRYAVTEMRGVIVLFSAAEGRRFTVDPTRRRLIPQDLSVQRAEVERLRAALGEVVVEPSAGAEDVLGYPCEHFAVRNARAEMVVSADVYCARIEGLGCTVLAQEREFERMFQPLSVPLADDQIIVRARTVVVARDFEHRQAVELAGIEAASSPMDRLEEYLLYPVARS
jgi:hypothetical protein